MRVIIFGAGKVGIDFYQEIKDKEEVVAFLDNDENKHGNEIGEISICSAKELFELQYDMIYIACLKYHMDIEDQLIKCGIDSDKISLLPVEKINNKKEREKIVKCLSLYCEACNEDMYEEKWDKIKKEYKKIEIYELRVDAIGELLQRLIPVVGRTVSEDVLSIFIPEVGKSRRIANRYLLNFLRKKIYIVHENEAAFWAYVLERHFKELDISKYYKFSVRQKFPVYRIDCGNSSFGFNGAEIEKGENFLKEISLENKFVCITARTPTYNVNTIGHDFDYDYRNMEFSDFKIAIEYLKGQGMQTVKMGRMESPIEKIDNCIDYAGLYADDFMDLYLSSKCDFFLANSTGSIYMPLLFGRPVLIVNSVPISLGFGGAPFTDKDLFIPKKYYDENNKRYLSLREMAKIESHCLIYGKRYKEKGISFINNTPEEIAMAVEEMVHRLRGTWKEDLEDRKNYDKYLEIYNEMTIEAERNSDNWLGGPQPSRIATVYLRNNLYLLE